MRRHPLLPSRQHLLVVVTQMQAFREKPTFARSPSLILEYIYSAAASSTTLYTDIKIQLLQPSHVD